MNLNSRNLIMTDLCPLHGGSWYHIPNLSRSAFRGNINPDDRDSKFGFRVVCNEPERSTSADKVVSGGCWDNYPRFCRSATRDRDVPGSTSFSFGFRVVCNEPERSTSEAKS